MMRTESQSSDGRRVRWVEWLKTMYGNQAESVADQLSDLVARWQTRTADSSIEGSQKPLWSERDVLLITYADQLRNLDDHPLAVLTRFLAEEGWTDLLRIVHLLPFCPYSSDDGFSVIDYRQVDPEAGTWDDVARLGEHVDLMFDLVLNHASAKSGWFESYLAGVKPYDNFFIEADPSLDLSDVVRPRSTPLLTPVETSQGVKNVWTTFSSDQVDLNYGSPDVFLEMMAVLLEYGSRGARIIRLDAIAYLWKEIGTNCIHLPQTHTVVKLMRSVCEAVFPGMILLTETNVPHSENISYFGQGDEAQMVYNFSLPPLLLEAMLSGDATTLAAWLEKLEPRPAGQAYLNFTASHDGIGVRPLEGLIDDDRLTALVSAVRTRGGFANTRRRSDGVDVPYELNITYVDALAPVDERGEWIPGRHDQHAARFLTSQALMLALRGIPAVYVQSLVGGRNDLEGARLSGQARRINRRKYTWPELMRQIRDEEGVSRLIYEGYRHLLAVRVGQAAFHPDADQTPCITGDSGTIAFLRTSVDRSQRIVCLFNVSEIARDIRVAIPVAGEAESETLGMGRDLLTGETVDMSSVWTIPPSRAMWIELISER